MVLSTLSTFPLEDVSRSSPDALKWFQLYVWRYRDITVEMIRRAEQDGFKALVITVDLPCPGKRRGDAMACGNSVPPGVRLVHIPDKYKSTPSKIKAEYGGVGGVLDPSLKWDIIKWMRKITKLPIVLKGILSPEDALLAVKHKVDGIIVSNHGGRQLDTVPATAVQRSAISTLRVYAMNTASQNCDNHVNMARGVPDDELDKYGEKQKEILQKLFERDCPSFADLDDYSFIPTCIKAFETVTLDEAYPQDKDIASRCYSNIRSLLTGLGETSSSNPEQFAECIMQYFFKLYETDKPECFTLCEQIICYGREYIHKNTGDFIAERNDLIVNTLRECKPEDLKKSKTKAYVMNDFVDDVYVKAAKGSKGKYSKQFIDIIMVCMERMTTQHMRVIKDICYESEAVMWKKNVDSANKIISMWMVPIEFPPEVLKTSDKRDHASSYSDVVDKLVDLFENHNILKKVSGNLLDLLEYCIIRDHPIHYSIGGEIVPQIKFQGQDKKVSAVFKAYEELIKKDGYEIDEDCSDQSKMLQYTIDWTTRHVGESNTLHKHKEYLLGIIDFAMTHELDQTGYQKLSVWGEMIRWILHGIFTAGNSKHLDPFIPYLVKLLSCDVEELQDGAGRAFYSVTNAELFAPYINELVDAVVHHDQYMALSPLKGCFSQDEEGVMKRFDDLMEKREDLSGNNSFYLLQLIDEVAKKYPERVMPYKDYFLEGLPDTSFMAYGLMVLSSLSNHEPKEFVEHVDEFVEIADNQPNFIYHIITILANIGMLNEEMAVKITGIFVELLKDGRHTVYLYTILACMKQIAERKYIYLLRENRELIESLRDSAPSINDVIDKIIDVLEGRSLKAVTEQVADVKEDVDELDERVTTTEQNVADLDEKVDNQEQEISDIKEEVTEQGERLDELEEVVDETVEKVEEIDRKTLKTAEDAYCKLRARAHMTRARSEEKDLKMMREITLLRNKCEYLDSRLRCNNVMFFNIAEESEGRQCTAFIERFIANHMGINIKYDVEYAHRVPKYAPVVMNYERPRPVLARLMSNGDKKTILYQAARRLKNNPYKGRHVFVNADYPTDIRMQRNKMMHVVQKMRDDNARCRAFLAFPAITISNAPAWSRDVSKLLNEESDHDWRFLAIRLGYSSEDVRNWATAHDPTMSLLSEWYTMHKSSEATYAVLTSLKELGRNDCVTIIEDALKAADEVIPEAPPDFTHPPPVFISYQWDHQSEVKTLKEHLEMAGYECWMDIGQMGGGDKLYEKIDEGLRGAKIVLSMCSEKYSQSKNCNHEINLASLLNKPIIPLLLEEIDWPPPGPMSVLFSQLLYIKFCPEKEYRKGEKFWSDSTFAELLGQINYHAAPDPEKISDEYKNYVPQVDDTPIVKPKKKQQTETKEDSPHNEENIEDPDVFISYQWGVQPQIKNLYSKLTSLGYTCWLDIMQMGGGDALYGKIDRGIRKAKVIVSSCTPKYALSTNCRREVSLADTLKKPMIPILLESMEWPPEGPMSMPFAQLLYIDFTNNNSQKFDNDKFEELKQQIDGYGVEIHLEIIDNGEEDGEGTEPISESQQSNTPTDDRVSNEPMSDKAVPPASSPLSSEGKEKSNVTSSKSPPPINKQMPPPPKRKDNSGPSTQGKPKAENVDDYSCISLCIKAYEEVTLDGPHHTSDVVKVKTKRKIDKVNEFIRAWITSIDLEESDVKYSIESL
uniref:Uncharacterized protein LOC100370439 n=1 Tax=Saccoglossus kowalevskii TaxID=10224 RepID=A0ABM0GZL4_SACKO